MLLSKYCFSFHDIKNKLTDNEYNNYLKLIKDSSGMYYNISLNTVEDNIKEYPNILKNYELEYDTTSNIILKIIKQSIRVNNTECIDTIHDLININEGDKKCFFVYFKKCLYRLEDLIIVKEYMNCNLTYGMYTKNGLSLSGIYLGIYTKLVIELKRKAEIEMTIRYNEEYNRNRDIKDKIKEEIKRQRRIFIKNIINEFEDEYNEWKYEKRIKKEIKNGNAYLATPYEAIMDIE